MTFEGAEAVLSPGPEMRHPEGEAGLSFRPKTLHEALRPLSESTGVDFWRYIARRYQVELRPDAIGPETGVKAKQEEVRSSVEDIEDLGPYFEKGVAGRTYFLLLGRLDHPDKPEKEWRDYVIMEQTLEGGATALAIFEYPDSEHAYHTEGEIMIDGRSVDTNYLRLRFAAVMLLKESEGDDWLVAGDAEALLENQKLTEAGLLPKEQELPDDGDGIINSRWCLLKDKKDARLVVTPAGPKLLSYKHFLEPVLLGVAVLKDNLGEKIQQKGPMAIISEVARSENLPRELVQLVQAAGNLGLPRLSRRLDAHLDSLFPN